MASSFALLPTCGLELTGSDSIRTEAPASCGKLLDLLTALFDDRVDIARRQRRRPAKTFRRSAVCTKYGMIGAVARPDGSAHDGK